MSRNRTGKILMFGVFSLVLGAAAGAVVWIVVSLANLGIMLLWDLLPKAIGVTAEPGKLGFVIYSLCICIAGGVIIGLWQRKNGILPDETEQVMGRIKRSGSYPYNRIHILVISALLPIIFGGTIGPEAGLIGVVAAVCCLVGDILKWKGDEVAALAEAGMAAAVGAIFNAPLFGIADNLESVRGKGKNRKRLVSKKTRIFIYVMGVIGGMAVMMLLSKAFGGGSGLPRFDARHAMGLAQWKWFVPMLVLSVLFGLYYLLMRYMTRSIGGLLEKHRVTSCVIAGVVVAIVTSLAPFTAFSGEEGISKLMENWQAVSPAVLVAAAVLKLFTVNVCVDLGWRGGSIFPLIFSGVAAGYAFASLAGMDGAFAVAVFCAGIYSYVNRKPVSVIMILLMCFPVTYILPIAAASFAASFIPAPKVLLRSVKTE